MPQQRQHARVMRAAVGDAGERRDQLRVVARVGLRLARVARALHARRAARARARRCPNRRRVPAASRARSHAAPWPVHSRRTSRAARPPPRCRASDCATPPSRAARAAGGIRAACRRCRRRGRGGEDGSWVTAPTLRARGHRPLAVSPLRNLRARGAGTSAHAHARAPLLRDQLRMPRSARPTSASISARVNGAPSAVPCTSTKPPAPVITTFMSVSHAESSA